MKRVVSVLLVAVALNAGLSGVRAQTSDSPVVSAARQFVNWYAAKDFPSIQGRLDSQLRQNLTVETIASGWAATLQQFGSFTRIVSIRADRIQGADWAHVKCQFERVVAYFHIAFGPTQRVLSYTLTPLTSSTQIVSAATQVAKDLADGKFDAVAALFNDDVRKNLPAATVRQVWNQLTIGRGKAIKFDEPMPVPSQAGETLEVTCEFEHGAVGVNVSFDAQGQIAGLFVSPLE
jgi:hypothetical protein